MCVIYFAYEVHPDYPLILIANRDEFYARPTAPAAFWTDRPDIFAGRDLVGGGTWLGITNAGRIAAVTNYREPGAPKGDLSRGALVAEFLKASEAPTEYLAAVNGRKDRYSGFNLLVGEFNSQRRELCYLSNRGNGVQSLGPGVYGLSNHLLDTPWPKITTGKEIFCENIASLSFDAESCFELLANETLAADADLPATGLEYELEKALSAIFIKTPIYGTRCSSVVRIDKDFNGNLEERVFV